MFNMNQQYYWNFRLVKMFFKLKDMVNGEDRYNEKNLRKAEGGTGLGGCIPPASSTLAR